MKFAVVVFPGSNCDHDAFTRPARARPAGRVRLAQGHRPQRRRRRDPPRRLLLRRLPALRRHRALLADHAAPSRRFAERGGLVLGICNGFQVLFEAGLLPGALVRNRGFKFRCEHVHVRVEQTDTPFTAACAPGQVLRLPIAHGEGNYYAEPDGRRAARERTGRWSSATATPAARSTDGPTRTARSTASPASATRRRNVVGLMPHPERASRRRSAAPTAWSSSSRSCRSLQAGPDALGERA